MASMASVPSQTDFIHQHSACNIWCFSPIAIISKIIKNFASVSLYRNSLQATRRPPPFWKFHLPLWKYPFGLVVQCTPMFFCSDQGLKYWIKIFQVENIFIFFSLPFYTMSLYQNDNNILFFPITFFFTFNWFFFSAHLPHFILLRFP